MFGRKSIFLAAILVLLLAACQPVSIEEANTQLCADLVAFKAAMGAVEALDADSSVDEAEAALDAADDAWNEVLNSAYVVRDAKYENLDQAYEDMDDAVRAIDEGDTLGDAAATLQAEVVNVNAAYDEFYNVQCVGQ